MLQTFLIIAEQAMLALPLIAGAYISISLMKVPDLSIETGYLFGAILGAKVALLGHDLPLGITLILALIASCLGGLIVGTVSSSLTQLARLPHLLSSIITIGLFHGVSQLVLGTYLSLSNASNPLVLGSLHTAHPEFLTLASIGCLVLISLQFLLRGQLGHALAVFGNNPTFFKHYRISTRYIFYAGILISNALAGLSGYLYAQSNGFVELTMAFGKPLMCITALILGKTIIRKRKPSILIPLIGCALYFAIQQLLLKIGFDLKYFTAVQSLIVLILLIIYFRKRSSTIDHLGV